MLKRLIICAVVGVLVIGEAWAGIPKIITFQGRLLKADGTVVEGVQVLHFSIYNRAEEGDKLWEGIAEVVLNQNGNFTAYLGEAGPLDLAFSEPYWLEIKLGDEIFAPRQALTAVPYAFQAENAETLNRFTLQEIRDQMQSIPNPIRPADGTFSIGENLKITGKLTTGNPDPVIDSGIQISFELGPELQTTNAIYVTANDPLEGTGVYGTGFKYGGKFLGGIQGIKGKTTERAVSVSYGGKFHAMGAKGIGVYGQADNVETNAETCGGKFISNAPKGIGLYGEASKTGDDITNYGGKFAASGHSGYGVRSEAKGLYGVAVYGEASDAQANNSTWGGKFYSDGPIGCAVWGEADNVGTDRKTYGGEFIAEGLKGVGVYAESSHDDVVEGSENYGGEFYTAGRKGSAVYGFADNAQTDHITCGGRFFSAAATNAVGVLGSSDNEETEADVYGGYFNSDSLNGRGIHAIAEGDSGIGIFGEKNFGTTAKFISQSRTGYGVYAEATATGQNDGNFGGKFSIQSALGFAVQGEATGRNGYGIYGVADGASRISVRGESETEYGYAATFSGGKGIKIPDLPSANARLDTELGTIFYNTTLNTIQVYTGLDAGWRSVSLSYDTAVDLAENFSSSCPEFEAGDVVSINPANKEKIIKCQNPYDTAVLGIISTDPAYTMAESIKDGKPVALAGRVPCKVSTENGPIKYGDLLTSSGTPGYAMKATNPKTGSIIGKALESFNKDTGKIIVLVTL